MKTDPDWALYRSFQAVFTGGSLSAAARQLALTQPTIGRQVEALEQALGLPLFTRSPQGLVPTQAAIDLMPHVRTMATAAETLIRQASGEALEARGTVRLTASEVIGGEVLPGILREFSDLYPGIEIELVLSNRIEDLLRREVDIAVRMIRPEQQALVARKLGTTYIGFFAHQSYLDKYGTPQTLEDLRHHRLIGFDRDMLGVALVQRLGMDYDKSLFTLRTDSDQAALRALREGYGICGCAWAIAHGIAGLVSVLPEIELVNYDIWIAMHEDLTSSRRMRLMFDHLAQHLTRHAEMGVAMRAAGKA
jgi:DNA-binding transcriptional LysR family regulator